MKVEIGSSNIGQAIMYHVDVGESLEAVYYPEKYRNHGSDLAFLSHHGYLALIEGVKKSRKGELVPEVVLATNVLNSQTRLPSRHHIVKESDQNKKS